MKEQKEEREIEKYSRAWMETNFNQNCLNNFTAIHKFPKITSRYHSHGEKHL